MILMNFFNENLHHILKPNHRILGLDIGTKTIGLALHCWGTSLVNPLETYHRKKYQYDVKQLSMIIHEWHIKALVIGLPLNMDGSSGTKVQSVKTTALNLSKDLEIPYCFEDERLSTSVALDRMVDIGVKASKRQNMVDSHAAQIILERWLTRVKHQP